MKRNSWLSCFCRNLDQMEEELSCLKRSFCRGKCGHVPPRHKYRPKVRENCGCEKSSCLIDKLP